MMFRPDNVGVSRLTSTSDGGLPSCTSAKESLLIIQTYFSELSKNLPEGGGATSYTRIVP